MSSLVSEPHQPARASPVTGGHPRLPAPQPRRSRLASLPRTVRAPRPESPAEPGRLTAVSLVAHVPAVIVKVTPPNAVDTVPIAAAILVPETGVLWTVGVGGGGNETRIILTARLRDVHFSLSFHFSSSNTMPYMVKRKMVPSTPAHGSTQWRPPLVFS